MYAKRKLVLYVNIKKQFCVLRDLSASLWLYKEWKEDDGCDLTGIAIACWGSSSDCYSLVKVDRIKSCFLSSHLLFWFSQGTMQNSGKHLNYFSLQYPVP